MRKMRSVLARDVPVLAVVTAALFWSSRSQATKTYFIDESTDFTGNGCQNTDLNDVTSYMKAQLDFWGFSGNRYTNANAWPKDFVEACSSSYWFGGFGTDGIDSTAADSKILSVYAGHGNVGSFSTDT